MKAFRTPLGRTRHRDPPLLFGPDAQIELRPWITGSRVGAILTVGLGVFLWIALPESHAFLLGALALGVLFGLILWWKHR
jgi:hypothetical protein